MRPGRRFTHKARFSRVLDRNQGRKSDLSNHKLVAMSPFNIKRNQNEYKGNRDPESQKGIEQFFLSLFRFDKEWGFDSQAEQTGETQTNHHTSSKRYHCHRCYLNGIGLNL